MYEKLESCPLCQSGQFQNVLIAHDYTASKESFAIVQCQNCKLHFTNPRPSLQELARYYKSDNYISHNTRSTRPFQIVYKQARRFNINYKLKLIQDLSTPRDILDVGCGVGTFLESARSKGWSVAGTEPDHDARAATEKKLGISLHPNLDPLVQARQQFSVITMWHVLEHVPDLTETISKLRGILKKDGYLIFAVPNINSYDSTHYGKYWAGLDVPRHLYHFTQQSFKRLCKQNDLRIRFTKPLTLDSYYVSIMSEKNMDSKWGFIKGLKEGRKSNQMALKTTEYSSLIYVVTK